ncbi:hypothetical protein V5O48_006846 [Marasmius crinis-equi]|uniref:F-box domain-containing protein n=1 Tax=Marasmius crinis-equi TaxID=585013 RepID=A0ABR3FIK0_9AGAR
MPIANLPTELICAIFELVVKLDNKPTMVSIGWTLAQVCVSWAKLLVGPSLSSVWSRLIIREDLIRERALDADELRAIRQVLKAVVESRPDGAEPGPEDNQLYEAFVAAMPKLQVSNDIQPSRHAVVELLSLTLMLSRNHPLSVSTERSSSTPIPYTPWIRHLSEHEHASDRWQHVQLLVDQYPPLIFPNRDYPLLETLEIDVLFKSPIPACEWRPPHPTLQICSAPCLRRVTVRIKGSKAVRARRYIKMWLPRSHITHLELDGKLFFLKVFAVRKDPQESLRTEPEPALLSLPNLISLQINYEFIELAKLHTPQLRRLVVVESNMSASTTSTSDDYYSALLTLLANSRCTLESLEFRIMRPGFLGLSNPTLSRILENSGPRRLSFCVVESRSLLSSINWEAMGSLQDIESLELQTIDPEPEPEEEGDAIREGSIRLEEKPDPEWALSFLRMVYERLTSLRTLRLELKDVYGQEAFRSQAALDSITRVRERGVLVVEDCGGQVRFPRAHRDLLPLNLIPALWSVDNIVGGRSTRQNDSSLDD